MSQKTGTGRQKYSPILKHETSLEIIEFQKETDFLIFKDGFLHAERSLNWEKASGIKNLAVRAKKKKKQK